MNGGKGLVLADAVQEVVGRALALDPRPGRHAVRADHLVQLLAVAPRLDAGHEDVFGGHEGQLGHHTGADHVRPHMQAVGNVGEQGEDHVHAQERLGQDDPAHRGVVQRALKPLVGVGVGSSGGQGHHVAGQAARPLAAHRVPLVRHRAGPNLGLGKGLFDLLQVGQKPHVTAHLVRRLRDAREHTEDGKVNLPGVGLARDGDRLLEAHDLAHPLVQGQHLLVVAPKELEEAGLGACGALHPPHGQVLNLAVQGLHVQHEVLHPQGAALAHRGELGGLVVGEPQGGHVRVLLCKGFHDSQELHQLPAQQQHALLELHQVCVVPHIAAGGPQVDHCHGLWTNLPKCVNMSHDIMSKLLFLFCGKFIIDIEDICFHFFNLLILDVQT
mmetsp:Transcript_11003/g.16205  ORF Transcript_11003/g.16205 Transcript_11003/m.16205 type:complete len:385 (+) Transcript_11003:367-1521(+)